MSGYICILGASSLTVGIPVLCQGRWYWLLISINAIFTLSSAYIQYFHLLPTFSCFFLSVRKQRAVLPSIYWSYTYVRASDYYRQFSPTAGDAESVLSVVWHRSVPHQHPSDRATGEQFSFRSVDKTLIWENRLVLQAPKVISGEVIW